MAGIDDHRQVGHLFQHRHSGNIQSIAHAVFKGADAALAQHHVGVSGGHDVLGAHHQFLQRGAEAALEQHRNVGASHRLEQLKILHVAGADLDHVHLFPHKQRNVDAVHQLGDNGLSGDRPGFGQQLQPFRPQSLEGVGAGAGLEGAAAQNRGTRLLDPFCHLGDLGLALHAAGTRHHRKMPAADADAAHFHHRVIGVKFAVGLFVGLGYPAAAFHNGIGQKPAFAQGFGVADQAKNMGVAALGIVDLEAHGLQFTAKGRNLVFGGVLFQDDDHTDTPYYQ